MRSKLINPKFTFSQDYKNNICIFYVKVALLIELTLNAQFNYFIEISYFFNVSEIKREINL